MVNWFPSVINMKLTQSLCFSSSNGSDELVDEEFILVLFLLFHLCIMRMWYKRDLNVFFASSSLPRGACKLNFWCVTERVSGSEDSLFIENPCNISQRLCVSWCCLNNTSWTFFLFMKWMPILFVESEIISEMIFKYHSLGRLQRQILGSHNKQESDKEKSHAQMGCDF